VVVDDEALLPDLSLIAGEHLDHAHLDHGLGELDLPRLLDGGVELDDPGRPFAVEQRLVGGEHDLVGEHVLEVLVVEAGRRDGVERHHGGVHRLVVVGRPRAPPLELLGVGGVDGRVGGSHDAGEVVEPLREGGAVGPADGVRAGQRDHLVSGEALALKALNELADAVGGEGHVVVEHLIDDGDAAVAAGTS
jgi:hypothetical protein